MDDIQKLMMFVILFDMPSNGKDHKKPMSRLEKPKYYDNSTKSTFKQDKNKKMCTNKNFKIKK